MLDKPAPTLAQGGNPKLSGKSMIDLKDVDDKHFIKAFLDVAATKKSTYVEKAGDLVIMCGIYKG